MSRNVDKNERPSTPTQYEQANDGTAASKESVEKSTNDRRVTTVDEGMDKATSRKYPDVSRMSKAERAAHFAEKRREKEFEAIRKLGLNPEDFPSARSTLPQFHPPGGRRRERQPSASARPAKGNRRERSSDSCGREHQSAPAHTITSQPQISAGYGDERVSGWGSSSSDETVNQPGPLASGWSLNEAAPATLPDIPTENPNQNDVNVSGWSLDGPPLAPVTQPKPAVSARVTNPNDLDVSGWSLNEPAAKPAGDAPKPAAPSRAAPSNFNDFEVSEWDVAKPMPGAAPTPAAPTSGDNWKIDRAPVGRIPERRPLYSYDAELTAPPKPVEQAKPAEPVRSAGRRAPVNPPKGVDSKGRAKPIKTSSSASKLAPIQHSTLPVSQTPTGPKPVQDVGPATVSRPAVTASTPAGNLLLYADAWDCDDSIPRAAGSAPVAQPVQPAPRVPEPVSVQAPSAPTVPRAAPRPARNLLDNFESGDCHDSIPISAPSAPLAPAPAISRPPMHPTPVQAASIVVAPAVSLPTPRLETPREQKRKPGKNPLEYVQSWGCDDPVPTAPSAAALPVAKAPDTVKCPNCRHCFRPSTS